MQTQVQKVLQTVGEPDQMQQGDFGELLAVRFYSETPLTEKFLVVVYKELTQRDGVILTAYFARRPLERRQVIWKR
ncbi:MAG: hypothetical protein HY686_08415 [Chloroflexi bacterium]|nr:hypothetical protein [Chloroflexota bacterium]